MEQVVTGTPSPEDKIVVEVFTLLNDHSPVEELVTAVTGVSRWKDRVEVEFNRTREWGRAETPYGTIEGNTVVVAGEYVISGPDYWTLQQALEDVVTIDLERA